MFLAIFYVAIAGLVATNNAPRVLVAFVVGAWLVGVPLAYVLAFKVLEESVTALAVPFSVRRCRKPANFGC